MVTASKTFFVGVDGKGDRRRGVEDDERGTKISCIFASAMCGVCEEYFFGISRCLAEKERYLR